MEAVGACMGACARRSAPPLHDVDVERWTVAGLPTRHGLREAPVEGGPPDVGVEHLKGLGVDDEIRDAIMGHTEHTHVPRVSPMSKSLFAVDELAGFIVACAKVRPNGSATSSPRA